MRTNFHVHRWSYGVSFSRMHAFIKNHFPNIHPLPPQNLLFPLRALLWFEQLPRNQPSPSIRFTDSQNHHQPPELISKWPRPCTVQAPRKTHSAHIITVLFILSPRCGVERAVGKKKRGQHGRRSEKQRRALIGRRAPPTPSPRGHKGNLLRKILSYFSFVFVFFLLQRRVITRCESERSRYKNERERIKGLARNYYRSVVVVPFSAQRENYISSV